MHIDFSSPYLKDIPLSFTCGLIGSGLGDVLIQVPLGLHNLVIAGMVVAFSLTARWVAGS